MTEHKFTDEELIRKLNTVMFTKTEIVFPLTTDGTYLVLYLGDLVDLINRQRDEIEEKSKRLREVLPIVAELKAEAIKEFAEQLKKYYRHIDKTAGALIEYTIDQKVKEFLEGGADDA